MDAMRERGSGGVSVLAKAALALALASLMVALGACGGASHEAGDGAVGADAGPGTGRDGGAIGFDAGPRFDAGPYDAGSSGCVGPRPGPACVGTGAGGCCTAAVVGVECIGGTWRCPPGTVDFSACGTTVPMCTTDFTACENVTQCTVTAASCCGWCGAPTATDVTAVNTMYLSAYRDSVCGDPPPPCPGCAGFDDPFFVPSCDTGHCRAVDLHTAAETSCTVDSDCQLRWANCCGCSGDLGSTPIIAVPRDRVFDVDRYFCESGGCPLDCAPVPPVGAPLAAVCTAGHCATTMAIGP